MLAIGLDLLTRRVARPPSDWASVSLLNDGFAGYSSLLRSAATKEEFMVLVETNNHGVYDGRHMALWLQRFTLA